MAIDVTFPDLDFPHRGEFERSEFVNKQEAAQDVLSDGFTTALNTFKIQANALETNVNNKEANVVAKHDIVVAKEALMNPHYEEIDNTSSNMAKISNLDTNMAKIANVNTNINDIISVADNEANINTVAENIYTIGSKIGAVDIHNSTSKTTPADNDELAILDSDSTFSLKKLTFANLKATLKTYFDTLYSRTSAIFGIGQTWQDMRSQRVAGVTYTNTTGKPIMVSIRYNSNGADNYITINGTFAYVCTHSSGNKPAILAVVPNNATYRLESAQNSIDNWMELI